MLDKVAAGVIKLIVKKFKLDGLEQRVVMLEKMAHPRRDFVVCNQCKKAIEQYEGTD